MRRVVAPVALYDLLRPVSRPEAVEGERSYRLLGAHWYAQGLYVKAVTPGEALRAGKVYKVRQGDFVYNRLFAWMGSFAVASPSEDGCYVSNEFLSYEVDASRLDVDYLWWFFRRPSTWRLALALSTGTTPTSRNRLKEEKFLGLMLPLPGLSEQRGIVARLESVRGRCGALRELRRHSGDTAAALAMSWRDGMFSGGFESVPLGSVAGVIDPNPSHRYPTYVSRGVPMITTSDFVGADEIDTSQAKHVPAEFWQETLGRHGVGPGDVIFARKGKVGYARPYPGGGPLAMTHTLCVLKPDRSRVDPRYLLHYARTGSFLGYLTRTMNPNLGVPTLGLDVIRQAHLPLPDLALQRRVAAAMDAVEAGLAKLSELQAESARIASAVEPAAMESEFQRIGGNGDRPHSPR